MVFSVCKTFSKDWKFIGSALGVNINTLQRNYKDVKGVMLEMLASWLRRESKEQPVSSWNILLTILSEYDRIETEQIASKCVCKHVK